jgi:hypothetical protein
MVNTASGVARKKSAKKIAEPKLAEVFDMCCDTTWNESGAAPIVER